MDAARTPIEIELNAAIVALEKDTPLVLVAGGRTPGSDAPGLPFGPFDPLTHRTLEVGLRSWVAEQTALHVGYVEQLYTFGDRGRHAHPGDVGPHVVSVGYLALTRPSAEASKSLAEAGAEWRSWYEFFPWEDWRDSPPPMIERTIMPALTEWAERQAARPAVLAPKERLRLAFGAKGVAWDEEKVLERYELLYEAGLVAEAPRDGRAAEAPAQLGIAMRFDHRRILATAIARLRGKLKYRPVVFELMAPEFTLTALQRTVEAISGRHLHKQNFRRLVEGGALVEATGATTAQTGGRPAALFRFRRDVLQERPSPGLRLGGRA
jgi:hypothetical protein